MDGAWDAWRLTPLTWAWIAWIAAFIVLETYALIEGRGQELTQHLRPIFTFHPLAWFTALGLYLWLGAHFLFYRWEHKIIEWFVGSGG